MDFVQRTQQTYVAIARRYFESNLDRSPLLPHLQTFCAHLPAGRPVLDVGCGPGFDAAWLRGHGVMAYGVDLSLAMMQTGRPFFPQVPFTQADMTHLPFASHTFGGVWASASLLHIPREQVTAVLAELRRVLLPNGVFYLSVKAGDGEGWAGKPGKKRFFVYWQPAQLDAVLADAGFTQLEGNQMAVRGVWLNRLLKKIE